MLKEFREFVTRGNLVDLAVAFIMAVAFAAVVTAFTDLVLGRSASWWAARSRSIAWASTADPRS